MTVTPWNPDTHGWVIRPDDAGWETLVDEHALDTHSTALRAVFDIVRRAGCRTIVVENRYVDTDYRSEYSQFWTRRFQDKPTFTRRLHFFAAEVDDEALHDLGEEARAGYLGYSVLRPNQLGPVGRTVVAPPPELAQATLALVRDDITLFGNPLTVIGAPFCQQDTEFLRCAHAAAWMCHYSSVRRGLVPRQPTAAFAEASPPILSWERPLPSKGMTLNQLQAVFGAFGQPALFYGLGRMPKVPGVEDPAPQVDADGNAIAAGYWDTRIFSVVARYLNSGYPVLIGTTDHAFVLIGWYRDTEDGLIKFVANDDQRGPYGVIESPFSDERAPWLSIMVPLPARVLMSAEAAEIEAHKSFSLWADVENAPEPWKQLARDVRTKAVSLRAVLRDASHYKAELSRRKLPEAAVRDLRLARLPHYIWVVEAHDRDARDAGRPCVLAEVLFDTTSNDRVPYRCALLLPGATVTYPPDGGGPTTAFVPIAPWESALPLAVG